VLGIFDSGLGGLTVARAVMDALPGYDMIYFGDTARTPYGAKSARTVEKYALETTKFLEEQLTEVKSSMDSLDAKLAEYREKHLEKLRRYPYQRPEP